MLSDLAGLFVRVAYGAYPFVIGYAILAAAIAVFRARSKPGRRPVAVALWSAGLVPGAIALVGIGMFAAAASNPSSGPEGNLFGMAIFAFVGALGIQCAVAGIILSWLAVTLATGLSRR